MTTTKRELPQITGEMRMNISINGNAFYTSNDAFIALESFVRGHSTYHLNKFWAMVKNNCRLDLALLADDSAALLAALVVFIVESDISQDCAEWFAEWEARKQVEWCEEDDYDDLLIWQRMELLENIEHENHADYWNSVAN